MSSKVHVLGMGWSTTVTPTPPGALIVLVKVPWDQTNQQHRLELKLVDGDGQPVVVGNSDQGVAEPLVIQQEFEVGRPPGLPPGFELEHSLALNLGPGMPLAAGNVYEWRLEIDGHHDETWSARFFVRAT